MDQKNSFQEIMYKVQPEWWKRKIVEILLGMSQEKVEQMNLKIQELTNEIDILKREVESIRNFLISSGGTNRLDITEKRAEKLKQYDALSIQIDRVKQQMRGEKGITDQLRKKLDHVNYNLIELEESKAKIQMKMKDFQALRNSLFVDRDKIRKTDEAAHLFSTIDVMKCPRCLQQITAEMRRREEHGDCKLCGRPLLAETMKKTKILGKDDVVDEEIKEVEILLNQYSDNLQQLTHEIAHLSTEKATVQQELDRQSQSYVSPFIDELERLLSQRNQVNTELELLNQQLRQWEALEKREQRLDQLQQEQHRLRIVVEKIDTGDASKIRKLSEYYESFLRRVGYPDLNTARIQQKNLMPLVNNHPYTEDTGYGWLSVKIIGYHYSLLEFSLETPCYYPRFLMLDSPRAYDLNLETYQKLLLQFHRLPEKFNEQDFQVILTTRDLPEEMEQYVIERINSKNRMLLRPEGQQEQARVIY
jgi:DNA repair exonuclease SbcCD ATPase subunit